ncbi:MAG: selenium cofactor biosynthesis protein YqeC [Proteobacteria bacterium]|nr:selenium cofactor biosynthesis protein YqeC [Pseudomonadota bacterium]MDA0951562.1 selenium cofactor biosynthesis protein YqeC [Pseudomonadota bacterium]
MTSRLIDALGARSGIVCVAGAGGKKTTMLRLARTHEGRVALTATSKIPQAFSRGDPDLLSLSGQAAAQDVLAHFGGERLVAYAGEPSRSARLRGADPDLIRAVHDRGGFAATYVKADGARMRLAKAHHDGEPRLIEGAAAVLLLASVRVVGKPLDDAAVHHHERFAELAGLPVGAPVTAQALGRVLAHQLSTIADAGHGRIVAVLNMADDEALLAAARDVAAAIRQCGARHPVAITAMLADDPLRDFLD